MQGAGDSPHSEFEQRSFSGLATPLVCIGRGRFLAANFWPFARQVCINLEKLQLILGDVFFWHDGVNRAFRHTQSAIDALFGVDYQKVRAFVKAFNRADFHAIGVFTFNAVFKDDERHGSIEVLQGDQRGAQYIELPSATLQRIWSGGGGGNRTRVRQFLLFGPTCLAPSFVSRSTPDGQGPMITSLHVDFNLPAPDRPNGDLV